MLRSEVHEPDRPDRLSMFYGTDIAALADIGKACPTADGDRVRWFHAEQSHCWRDRRSVYAELFETGCQLASGFMLVYFLSPTKTKMAINNITSIKHCHRLLSRYSLFASIFSHQSSIMNHQSSIMQFTIIIMIIIIILLTMMIIMNHDHSRHQHHQHLQHL